MKREFSPWLKTMKRTIANYSYYTDFEKVYENIDKVKIELHMLNSLVNSKNIETEFEALVRKYPSVLKCIPLLIAVRDDEISTYTDTVGEKTFKFNAQGPLDTEISEYKYFMRESGLFDLLKSHLVSNLVDYSTGVEVGLDSNGRKNRGGHLMEDLVEQALIKAGFRRDVSYFKEMQLSSVEKKWGLDLSALSNQGKTEKRFDFVVKGKELVYLIETNFYTSGGSKLNETARSYKTLALEMKDVVGAKFVWFTDGLGWISARHNLEETFDVLDDLYNINDINKGIMKSLFV